MVIFNPFLGEKGVHGFSKSIKPKVNLNRFGLAWFYGISTLVGYLIPNTLYTYILNIYDLVWLEFTAYQPL